MRIQKQSLPPPKTASPFQESDPARVKISANTDPIELAKRFQRVFAACT